MKDVKVVELLNVTKIYTSHSDKYIALNQIDFTACRSELLLLLGPSGSGKTTLLTLAAGFTQASSGNVFLFGQNINQYSSKELQYLRADKIGFIFQTFLLIDALNVYENVELVLKFSKNKRSDYKEKTTSALEKLGISHLSKKLPSELSHGERQRVAIARAFANNAELLIADEPTASLETKQGEQIINFLHDYASKFDKCVIVASHDLRLKSFADRIIFIENGFLIK